MENVANFPVTEFQHGQGEACPQLETDQFVILARKLDNPPRTNNAAVPQLIDRVENMPALIVGLKKSNNWLCHN